MKGWGKVSKIGVRSQIGDVNVLILSLNYGSNVVDDGQPQWISLKCCATAELKEPHLTLKKHAYCREGRGTFVS